MLNFERYALLVGTVLLCRNEGKIKSYDSCFDLRAWSHDRAARDRYLRDSIKLDSPTSFIPSGKLASFMISMVHRDRSRVPPRCHPDCKSKVVLESICDSCGAITECLKKDGRYGKLFQEEEFETSHWPCERCMDALKAIKMFWKIMLQKVFRVTIPQEQVSNVKNNSKNSPKLIVQEWQSKIVGEAYYVQNTMSRKYKENGCFRPLNVKPQFQKQCPCYSTMTPSINSCSRRCNKKEWYESMKHSTECHVISSKTKKLSRNTSSRTSRGHKRALASKNVVTKIQTSDVCTESMSEDNAEVEKVKNKLDNLKKIYRQLKGQLDILIRENSSLREELTNVYEFCTWKATYEPVNYVSLVPKASHYSSANLKSADSETIITMKKCKNNDYHHISVLQVLHKSNNPTYYENNLNSRPNCYDRENPVEVLEKIRDVFGSILSREMMVLSEGDKSSLVDATSQKLHDMTHSNSIVSSDDFKTFTSARDLTKTTSVNRN